MPAPRKIAIGAAALLGALLLALVALPLLFRDRVAERIRAAVARSVDAEVRWEGAGLGLLGDFPNLTLRLDELSVAGVGRFDGDTLARVERLGVVLDLASVVRNLRRGEPIVVREVELVRPVARLLVLEDGAANWDIVREDPDADPDPLGRRGER